MLSGRVQGYTNGTTIHARQRDRPGDFRLRWRPHRQARSSARAFSSSNFAVSACMSIFPTCRRTFSAAPGRRSRRKCGFHTGSDLDTDFEERYRSDLLAAFESELRPMPGVTAVIDELGVASCVATSSSPKRARRSLALSGLAPYFGDRLFTASQVKNGKPAPDIFLFTARSMGVEPARCLVIEDSMPGVAAARTAGMRVWRFNRRQPSQGPRRRPARRRRNAHRF